MGKSTSELSSGTRVVQDLPKNALNFMASTHKRSRRQPGAQARSSMVGLQLAAALPGWD